MASPIVWYVKMKSGTSGPFTPIQLKGFADSGKLPKSALVSKNIDGPWVTAEHIRGLFQEPQCADESTIRPSDLVPDAVKNSAVVVGDAMTGLSKKLVSSIRSAASNLSNKFDATATAIVGYCEDGQDPQLVEKMIGRVREICTTEEEILYIAVQQKPIANFSPDCVVLSNKRFIIYRAKMLGRMTFYDCLWKDSKDVHLKENILGAEISFESNEGHLETIDYLPKAQARRIYRMGQELEDQAIKLRRAMDLESLQSGADKTLINQVLHSTPPGTSAEEDDIVNRMTKLRALLENGLITEAEFQNKRSQILDSI